MIINFLHETKEAIYNSNHSIEDIIFIGTYGIGIDRVVLTWDKFAKTSNFEYNNNCLLGYIKETMLIIFSDKSKLERFRDSYSEGWKYIIK